MSANEFRPWEVWYANFPYEEQDGRWSKRPVVILHVTERAVLVAKITTHSKRRCDDLDVVLHHWKSANLNKPSVIRVSKIIEITPENFIMKIGSLGKDDSSALLDAYTKFVFSKTDLSSDMFNLPTNSDDTTS